MLFASAVLLLSSYVSPVMADTTVEQMGLNYGDSMGEMMVTFASFSAQDETAVCNYGTDANDLSMSAPTTSSTYSVLTYTSPSLYTAILKDLPTGNKEIFYSCGSSSLGFSEVQSFKTHPGLVDDVTFFVVGDVGQTSNSVNTFNELLEYEALLSSASGGIISMGDLSYANGNQPKWDSFGNLRQPVAAKIPFQTTLGNHEWLDTIHNLKAYKARFQNPSVDGKKELYYSFNAGLVHFVMVSGYCPEMLTTHSQPCLADGTAQKTWLKADLAGVDRSVTPWVVVSFHQPYVNSNNAHSIESEGIPMENAIEDVLFENKVDLVFSGHVHAYERSCQVYQYKCTPGAPYYITIGDGGNHEGLATGWVEPQPEWSAYRQASYGFGELHAVNATHMHWAWHQNQDLVPTVADEFTLVKDQAGGLRGRRSGPSQSGGGITGQPVFANSARGATAQEFNAAALKEQSRLQH